MANLLPKENLQETWSAFISRFTIVSAIVLGLLAVLALAALLPSYIVVRAEAPASESAGTVVSAGKEERDALLKSQSILSSVAPFLSAASSPSGALKSALALLPTGIELRRVGVVAGSEGIMTITGTTQNRDAISQYRDVLLKSGLYKTVSVPVDALVGVGDGTFTITLTGAF